MLGAIATQHSHVLEFPKEEKMLVMLTSRAGSKSNAFELMTGHPMQDPGWMLEFYYLVHCIRVLGSTQCQVCCVRGRKSGDALHQLHRSREP